MCLLGLSITYCIFYKNLITKELMMLKKTLAVSVVALSLATPAMAIELPKDATLSFSKPSTAYSSMAFDKILQAYQLQLDTAKADQLPTSYAKVSDGKAHFNAVPVAYSPSQYHSILTAYGLLLTTADAKEKLSTSSYAKVSGDKVMFGSGSVAYGGNGWENILSAYSLPQVVMMPKPGDADGDGVTDAKDNCPETPYKVVVDERGCWVLANALLFDFDSAVIKKELTADLDKTKAVFEASPGLKVVFEGHTDSTGPEDYNQKLSERRAKALVNYFVDNLGIAADRFSAVGYGETKPAYSNDTKEGQAKNRRVEVTPAK